MPGEMGVSVGAREVVTSHQVRWLLTGAPRDLKGCVRVPGCVLGTKGGVPGPPFRPQADGRHCPAPPRLTPRQAADCARLRARTTQPPATLPRASHFPVGGRSRSPAADGAGRSSHWLSPAPPRSAGRMGPGTGFSRAAEPWPTGAVALGEGPAVCGAGSGSCSVPALPSGVGPVGVPEGPVRCPRRRPGEWGRPLATGTWLPSWAGTGACWERQEGVVPLVPVCGSAGGHSPGHVARAGPLCWVLGGEQRPPSRGAGPLPGTGQRGSWGGIAGGSGGRGSGGPRWS